LTSLRKSESSIPSHLSEKTVVAPEEAVIDFFDPMGEEEEGVDYRMQSIAVSCPVMIKRKPISTQESTKLDGAADSDGAVAIDTGLVVLAVEGYQRVIQPVDSLTDRLLKLLLSALVILACVAFGMWWLVNRTWRNRSQSVARFFSPSTNRSLLADRETEVQR